MRLQVFAFSIIAATGMCLAVSSSAHHSQSEFDFDFRVEVEGSVTLLEWKSPHARLYVDVQGEDGEMINWDFELPSPTTLMRRGWSRTSLQPGDKVSVTGFRARNFPTIAYARTIRDADGNGVFTGITEVN